MISSEDFVVKACPFATLYGKRQKICYLCQKKESLWATVRKTSVSI